MIEIPNSLHVSMVVLEILRMRFSDAEYRCTVGTFQNGRESGFTFRMFPQKDGYKNAFTWCVYEHRNSDEIIINGCKGYIDDGHKLPYSGDSKWIYLASFSRNQHCDCAEALNVMMKEHWEKFLIDKKPDVAV